MNAPDRNLGLDLVRVTEAAALASARWVGCGEKERGDGAAVDAMRALINTVGMSGTVVIGEGEKDNAPMLFNGEQVGTGFGPECDVAVDPVDGTTLLSRGQPNAVSVIAVAPRGTMLDASSVFYMEKLVVGPHAAGSVDLDAPVAHNIAMVAKSKGGTPHDVTVVMLDRPRHAELADDVRAAGARIRFISDGDVAGAIMAARAGSGVDMLMGTGGSPEGVIAAAALTCLGGEIQARLRPGTDVERRNAAAAGLDIDALLTTSDLVSSDDVYFCLTGVTDGELAKGVHYDGSATHTWSVMMRGQTGTIREIHAVHSLDKLGPISAVNYAGSDMPSAVG